MKCYSYASQMGALLIALVVLSGCASEGRPASTASFSSSSASTSTEPPPRSPTALPGNNTALCLQTVDGTCFDAAEAGCRSDITEYDCFDEVMLFACEFGKLFDTANGGWEPMGGARLGERPDACVRAVAGAERHGPASYWYQAGSKWYTGSALLTNAADENYATWTMRPHIAGKYEVGCLIDEALGSAVVTYVVTTNGENPIRSQIDQWDYAGGYAPVGSVDVPRDGAVTIYLGDRSSSPSGSDIAVSRCVLIRRSLGM